MQQQINVLGQRVASLESLTAANHAENRRDIHRLSNGQQLVIDALTAGLDKLGDKIDRRVASFEESVGKRFVPIEIAVKVLELKWAKATGYAMAIAGISAGIFELIKFLIEQLRGK